MTNPVTKDRRHFEDLTVGEVIDLGRAAVSKEMIVTFAREFDPFPFHLDEAAAKASLLGGLASSGWQTGALSLRMLVDSFLSTIASCGGLGFRDNRADIPPVEHRAACLLCEDSLAFEQCCAHLGVDRNAAGEAADRLAAQFRVVEQAVGKVRRGKGVVWIVRVGPR